MTFGPMVVALLKKIRITFFAVLALFISTVFTANAGEAQVVKVEIRALGGDEYRIDTTLEHADTGWDHYADAWLVFDEQGKLLGERVLYHPHVNEQPFTRSLTVKIPASVKTIIIKAKDSVHGLSEVGKEIEVPK